MGELDSNALTRWLDRHPAMLALLEASQQSGGAAYVPTVCLVESLRGTPADAVLHQRLGGCQPVPLTELLARSAARLRDAVDGHDVVDPVVAATASHLDAVIVSGDRDLLLLAHRCDPPIEVVDPGG
ncbi:MAG: type II toxin-antitoxin system VapC family toxin [Nitriliruptoraceae bacterium]